ncbi:hypothetical protein BASA81_015299 [Batrachochytrium salamandrivorans]|nr:hypothetical protein BASA81_015299 [Batrachochytrium salamandrivorans]
MYTVHLASCDKTNNTEQLNSPEDIAFAMEHSSVLLDLNADRVPPSKFEIFTATISSKPATHFVITTKTRQVRRTYRDFCYLNVALQIRFPGAFVPPLPPPRLLAIRKLSSKTRQGQLLLRFLQAVARNEYLLGDCAFADFFDQDVAIMSKKQCLATRQVLLETGELSASSKRWSFYLANHTIAPHAFGRCLRATGHARKHLVELKTKSLLAGEESIDHQYEVMVAKAWLKELVNTGNLLFKADMMHFDLQLMRQKSREKYSVRLLAKQTRLEDKYDRVRIQANRQVKGILEI